MVPVYYTIRSSGVKNGLEGKTIKKGDVGGSFK